MNYTKKEPRLALFSKNNKKMIEESFYHHDNLLKDFNHVKEGKKVAQSYLNKLSKTKVINQPLLIFKYKR